MLFDLARTLLRVVRIALKVILGRSKTNQGRIKIARRSYDTIRNQREENEKFRLSLIKRDRYRSETKR